jgi:hypothetical protein
MQKHETSATGAAHYWCCRRSASPKTRKTLDAAKQVEALERQRFEAQVKQGLRLLDKFFGEDLVYTHSNGKQDNKTSYIQSIRDGKSVYDKIDVEALNVRAYNDGQAAVVNGTITITSPNKPDGSSTLPTSSMWWCR